MQKYVKIAMLYIDLKMEKMHTNMKKLSKCSIDYDKYISKSLCYIGLERQKYTII